ncbi:flagellar attachment zone protein 1-like [Bacillus rossius redtenbacheri]|uniref:flagellar attachment zone protein 1-like n=1 Tax=Bacillus rossius redtenbacheri TaxID=93214 RepID=UPI002FDC9570
MADGGLREALRESLACQHEAMHRALQLQALNVQLEAEAREKDAEAVSLEASCNTAVRQRRQELLRQEERLEEALQQVLGLEKEALHLAADNKRLTAELEQTCGDCQRLQRFLDQCHQEKKRLARELSQHVAQRRDLALEIDRLACENTALKARLTELQVRQCK